MLRARRGSAIERYGINRTGAPLEELSVTLDRVASMLSDPELLTYESGTDRSVLRALSALEQICILDFCYPLAREPDDAMHLNAWHNRSTFVQITFGFAAGIAIGKPRPLSLAQLLSVRVLIPSLKCTLIGLIEFLIYFALNF
jgi:hypothetical protein